ncbi:MAG: nitrous oxide reductase accessory protein NosL [Deltaproteobacteria bacterium]|nr:nitrous oxide reductase accessory protein NosL [Deltaproteobacteria bacterium]
MFTGKGSLKRSTVLSALVLAFLLCAGPALAAADIEDIPFCKYCGMDRLKFAHSRVLITYDDGTKFGACSLHCAAVDLALNIDKAPVLIEVGDLNTRELIDAEKAFWVIGGDRMGVMTKRAKWAFAGREEAEKFVSEHGGTLATLDEALKAAFEDMYGDVQMIRKKRQEMREKKGK